MTRSEFTAIWDSMADLARSIGEGETTVRNWFLRGSIPPRYDDRLFEAARARGRLLTPADLHSLRKDLYATRDSADQASGAAA